MKAFDPNNYVTLYTQTEITILHQKRDIGTNGWGGIRLDIPQYVILFRDDVIPELYDNPMLLAEGSNLTQLVASAYKEMFYQHFARGEVWKGRALERALGMTALSITGQSLYNKCDATHWAFKVGPYSDAGGSKELATVLKLADYHGTLVASVQGSRYLKGDTPTNGKQHSTLAVAEITVNNDFIWTERGNSRAVHPLQKASFAIATPFGKAVPTFGEIVTTKADKIRQFVSE